MGLSAALGVGGAAAGAPGAAAAVYDDEAEGDEDEDDEELAERRRSRRSFAHDEDEEAATIRDITRARTRIKAAIGIGDRQDPLHLTQRELKHAISSVAAVASAVTKDVQSATKEASSQARRSIRQAASHWERPALAAALDTWRRLAAAEGWRKHEAALSLRFDERLRRAIDDERAQAAVGQPERECVQDVVVALSAHVLSDARLLQQIGGGESAENLPLFVELDVEVLAEARGVVVTHGLGVADGLHDWVGLHQPRRGRVVAPHRGQRVLHALQPPQEGEDLPVLAHRLGGEEDRDGRGGDAVVERQAVPPGRPRRVVQPHLARMRAPRHTCG